MVGFITKTLLNLVPRDVKKGLESAPTLTPKYQRSIDDITLPYLRPNNYPQPVTIKDTNRYDITALVFLKTKNKRSITPPTSVREANYWRNSTPFWNTAIIKRSLWWKYLHAVTIREAKQIIAREVMDKIYKDIYQRNEPIIAVKVVLFNGTTDEILDPKVLRDPWFSKTAFNQFKIDRRNLNAWGIKSGERAKSDPLPLPRKSSFDVGSITTVNLTDKLRTLNIDLDAIIKESFIASEGKLSIITNQNSRYRIKSKLRALLNGDRFKKLFAGFFVSKLRTSKFAKQFSDESMQENLVRSTIEQIISDFIDKEAENL